jgi:hypothetical protein
MTEQRMMQVNTIPLWDALAQPDRLRYEIQKLARDFGYAMARTPAESFNAPYVVVELRVFANYREAVDA